jgi:hypothetical protein
MSKMFKLTLLALVSAFLVGCGSDGSHHTTPEPGDDEVPTTVQGYFPDFTGDASYTREGLVYYPVGISVANQFLTTLKNNNYQNVSTATLTCYGASPSPGYIKGVGCTGYIYSSQRYAILEDIETSYAQDSKVMDIPEEYFTSYFPKHEGDLIGVELLKNFGTNYALSTFQNYGNSLTGSPYNLIPATGSSASCWANTKNGLYYEWCYGHNIDDEMIARWTIVKNAHRNVLESLR